MHFRLCELPLIVIEMLLMHCELKIRVSENPFMVLSVAANRGETPFLSSTLKQ